MAEVKNSFLASKMNQDLDDRLIPSNEYREAFNVAISQSEDSDVGAVENIRGTASLAAIADGEVIGYIVDEAKDDVYLFCTDYTDESAPSMLLNHQAGEEGNGSYSSIYRYNINSKDFDIIVSGRWLNFSTTHPIYGINILEDLLFWTDNRNQPRRININKAISNPSHYSNEDHVSVAKYAPHKPIQLFKDYSGTYKTTMKDATSEKLPNGSTDNPDYNDKYAGDPVYLEDKFVRFSYRFKFEDGEYSIVAPFTQIAFIPKQDGSFLPGQEDEAYKSTVVSFMENKVNLIDLQIQLPLAAEDLASELKIAEIDILYKESDSNLVNILDTLMVQDIESVDPAATVYEYSYQSRKPVKSLPSSQSTRVYDKTPVRALSQEVSGNRIIYGNYIDKHTAPRSLNYQVTANRRLSAGLGFDYASIEYPEHTLKRNRNYQVGFILSDRYGRESDVILSSFISNNTSNGFGASSLYFPYKSDASDSVVNDIGNSLKVQVNEQIKSTLSPLSLESSAGTGEPGLYDETTNPTGWYSYKIVVKQTQQEYYNVYLPGFINGYLDAAATDVSKVAHAALVGDNINKVPRELKEVGPIQSLYSSDAILYPVVENQTTSGVSFNIPVYPGDEKYSAITIASYEQLDELKKANSHNHVYNSEENPLIVRVETPSPLGETEANDVAPFLSIAETSPFESNVEIYYETTSSGLISELNSSVVSSAGEATQRLTPLGYFQQESQNYNGSGVVTGAADSPYVTDAFFPRDFQGNNILTAEITSFNVKDGNEANRNNDFELNTTGAAANGYRIKIKKNFYYSPTALVDESYKFLFNIRNQADDTSATVNGATLHSNVVVLDNITPNKPIFKDMFIIVGGSGSGIKVSSIVEIDMTALTATVELTSIQSFADGTTISFRAPSFPFEESGRLRNVAPSIDSFSLPSPMYYSLPSSGNYNPLIAFTGKNGTSVQSKQTEHLEWGFENPTSVVGEIETLSFTSSTYSTYSLNKSNGKLWRSTRGGYGNDTMKIKLTDSGGATVSTNDIVFEFGAGSFEDSFSTAFNI